MREVKAQEITRMIKSLCIESNLYLPGDLAGVIEERAEKEANASAKAILQDMQANMTAAAKHHIPVCQDTGMAVVFAEIGQEVHIDGSFEDAVNEGVRQGYIEGLLRCSVVGDPLRRENTGDNTPAVIHTRLVPGNQIRLQVAPKGFGSENMSCVKMMNPSASPEDIIRFVVETVTAAGSNPCPPVVVGVGIGGDFEYCAYLAKKALCRDVSEPNPDPFYADLEEEMLDEINGLDIGPQGFGGETTALAVMIEAFPTHIAGLPVAVNMGCHVTRHQSAII